MSKKQRSLKQKRAASAALPASKRGNRASGSGQPSEGRNNGSLDEDYLPPGNCYLCASFSRNECLVLYILASSMQSLQICAMQKEFKLPHVCLQKTSFASLLNALMLQLHTGPQQSGFLAGEAVDPDHVPVKRVRLQKTTRAMCKSDSLPSVAPSTALRQPAR